MCTPAPELRRHKPQLRLWAFISQYRPCVSMGSVQHRELFDLLGRLVWMYNSHVMSTMNIKLILTAHLHGILVSLCVSMFRLQKLKCADNTLNVCHRSRPVTYDRIFYIYTWHVLEKNNCALRIQHITNVKCFSLKRRQTASEKKSDMPHIVISCGTILLHNKKQFLQWEAALDPGL